MYRARRRTDAGSGSSRLSGSSERGGRRDKEARSEFSLLHTPHISNTLFDGISRKPETQATQK
jgi:hypothetical protein